MYYRYQYLLISEQLKALSTCLLKPGLKGLSHQIFKAFFMTYDIKSVLSAWALMVFKFFHLVVILIF
jgi:hypothetical protein